MILWNFQNSVARCNGDFSPCPDDCLLLVLSEALPLELPLARGNGLTQFCVPGPRAAHIQWYVLVSKGASPAQPPHFNSDNSEGPSQTQRSPQKISWGFCCNFTAAQFFPLLSPILFPLSPHKLFAGIHPLEFPYANPHLRVCLPENPI